jgi:hypothetical protein
MLTQAAVTKYAKYHALKNLLDKWLEKKREEILAAIGVRQNPETKKYEAAEPAPAAGPYLLEVGDAEKRPNWKDEFRKHLIASGSTEGEADLWLRKIAEQEREREPRLYCKVNPNYRRKFEIRLPA